MMTQTVVLVLLGLFSNSLGYEKYVFVDEVMPFTDAEAYCNDNFGTSLASIHSEADNLEATSLCVPQAGDKRPGCLIGLNDLSNERVSDPTGWLWTDGTTTEYLNWHQGEPNDYYHRYHVDEDCVLLYKADGTWYDSICSWTGRILCNNPKYSRLIAIAEQSERNVKVDIDINVEIDVEADKKRILQPQRF